MAAVEKVEKPLAELEEENKVPQDSENIANAAVTQKKKKKKKKKKSM